MGPWQTGTEGARSLAERVRSLVGGSGEVRKDPGLDGKGGDKWVKVERKSVKNFRD